MRNLFVRTAVFILLLGVLLYGTQCLLLWGLRSAESPPFGFMNRIIKGQINSNILIIGSSRGYANYDGNIIHSVTNRW